MKLHSKVTVVQHQWGWDKREKKERIIEKRLKEDLEHKQQLKQEEEDKIANHKIEIKPVP